MVVCIALFAAGCSTTTLLNPRDTSTCAVLNEELAGRRVSIELRDGRQIDDALVMFQGDSVTIPSLDGRSIQKFHLADIETISHFSRARGFSRDLGYGAFGGAAFGFTAGFVSGNDSPGFFSMKKKKKMLLGTILWGGVGGIGGMLVGTITGSTDHYILTSDTANVHTKAPANTQTR